MLCRADSRASVECWEGSPTRTKGPRTALQLRRRRRRPSQRIRTVRAGVVEVDRTSCRLPGSDPIRVARAGRPPARARGWRNESTKMHSLTNIVMHPDIPCIAFEINPKSPQNICLHPGFDTFLKSSLLLLPGSSSVFNYGCGTWPNQ